MKSPIAYYVHHHGEGHLQRALAIAAYAPDRIVLMGTGLCGRTGGIQFIDLPDDRLTNSTFVGDDGARNRPSSLHYAPLAHDGVRSRTALVANWIAANQPALFISDVSVEMAMLARLCSTPLVYVRLSGRRQDLPHLAAYSGSEALLVPFDARLDDLDVPDWVRQKTIYCPGIMAPILHPMPPLPETVTVVIGKGGTGANGNELAAAARSMPFWRWRVIGPCTIPKNCPSNLEIAGWVDDPAREIARADVVIGAAGDGLVGLVIAAARPFICIPENRPYEEQRQKADALSRNGAAIVLDGWPAPEAWTSIIAAAKTIELENIRSLSNLNGTEKAWQALKAIAER